MKSVIFTLDGRTKLVDEIIKYFNKNTTSDDALVSGLIEIKRFSDGEINVQYGDSVRGKRVYLMCSPINSDLIMTLNLAIDAAKRASAKEIIPILPFYPYSRQDKKDVRGPIGAKVMAEMLEHRGSTSVILFDLHADQVQGFFNIPVIHLESKNVFDGYIESILESLGCQNVILSSVDAGGTKKLNRMVSKINTKLGINLNYVVIDKVRVKANEVESVTIIGDVKYKHVIILDDMIDTFGSADKAIESLLNKGAKSVRMVASHGILSGPALNRLSNSKLLELVISDSLQLNISEGHSAFSKIKIVSIAEQISLAIDSINWGCSLEEKYM
jgi:ribose-phosphate pyrophosphokinase